MGLLIFYGRFDDSALSKSFHSFNQPLLAVAKSHELWYPFELSSNHSSSLTDAVNMHAI